MEKFEQNITKETFPETFPANFPMPVIFTPEQIKEREEKKVESPYDEHCFYFKDGQLDKEWINNMWYVLRGKTWDPHYAKPKDIEISQPGEFLIDHIYFDKYFGQSAAFKEMVNRPENDPKRQQVIDYMSDMVVRTFSADLRKKIAKCPGLSEKNNTFIKNEIQNSAFFMRENNKWTKKIDSKEENPEEPEELKQFRSMSNNNRELEHEIGEILTKEKLW